MTMGWPWPILRQGQISELKLFYRKMPQWWILWKFCSLWPGNWLIYLTKWVNIGLWGSLVLCLTSYTCRYPRPRYQVSVTNGPLVFLMCEELIPNLALMWWGTGTLFKHGKNLYQILRQPTIFTDVIDNSAALSSMNLLKELREKIRSDIFPSLCAAFPQQVR